MPTALLIIDIQNILCAGARKARDVDDVISRINIVSAKARTAGALVVVVQHETINGEMDYGTENWKLASALELHGTDVVLRKPRPMPSCAPH
jgi:nicotinamidase-related amidase